MKLVFFDIDGTLYPDHSSGMPNSAKRALNKLKKNGHKIFICTGRPLRQTREIMAEGIDFDGFICGAGSYVEIKKEVIYNYEMTKEEVKEVISAIEKLGIGVEVCGDKHGYFNDLGKKLTIENIINHRNDIDNKTAVKMFEEIFHYAPLKQYINDRLFKYVINYRSADSLDKFIELFSDKYQIILGSGNSAEVISKEYNKATGIRKICEYLNYSIEDCVAIGDSLNDLEMVSECKVGIAMGNAVDQLKEVADYITTNASDDGIYNAMKAVKLI